MFDLDVEQRLSAWAQHRLSLENLKDLEVMRQVWEFWKLAPFIPYNRKVDPFYQRGWPSPWEIIVENKYDDFTKALMIGCTLKLTSNFKNSSIEIKTLIDKQKGVPYNIVCIDSKWAINYQDNGPCPAENFEDLFLLENLIELKSPR